MEKILLDTSFILSCIRNKIDFIEDLSGRKVLLPVQVVNELESIGKKGKYSLKKEAEFALKILEKSNFERIDLGENYVDKGIKKFIQKNKDIIVATLDKGLKKPKSRNMIIIRKKRIEII